MCKHIYCPEKIYPKGTFFTYLISWTDLDIHYYGVRYGKYVRPSDLWKTYFTSSTPLKEFRTLNGEPDIVKIDFVYDTKEEAIEYEVEFLTGIDAARNSQWLNKRNGNKNYYCTGHTEETRKKMIESHTGMSHSEETKKKIGDRQRGIPKNPESVKKTANKKRGSHHSEATKLQMSIDRKGRIRINNGINEKNIKPEFIQEHLDLGWIFGCLPKSEETLKRMSEVMKGKTHLLGFRHSDKTKEKMSKSGKGKKHSEEHIKNRVESRAGYFHSEETKSKLSEKAKGKIWVTNNIIQKRVTTEEAEQLYPLGFFRGRIITK